jgi:hypothetical protein
LSRVRAAVGDGAHGSLPPVEAARCLLNLNG